MIISFARTTASLLARRKRVTRREWSDPYYAKFKRKLEEALGRGEPGLICDAWSASPHRKGKFVATILVTSITREPTRDIPDSDWEDEGFAYMEENGIMLGAEMGCFQQWSIWRQDGDKETSVIRFEVLEIVAGIVPEMFFAKVAA